jgi:hypothetical protein
MRAVSTTTYRNSLRSDRQHQTVASFMDQELVKRVPGVTPLTAAEFAAINYLHSFPDRDILQITAPIHVDVKMRGGVTHRFQVWVRAPNPKRCGASWTVSAERRYTN